MKKLTFFGVCCILSSSFLSAQNKKITIETSSEIVWAGVDRPGDLFLVLKTGEVQKFNKSGKKIGSHGFKGSPTLFEPMDGVQSFFYFREEKLFGNLSSDFESVTQHPLDPAFAIAPCWYALPCMSFGSSTPSISPSKKQR